jgi:hypothetical protein
MRRVPDQEAKAKRATSAGLISSGLMGRDMANAYETAIVAMNMQSAIRMGYIRNGRGKGSRRRFKIHNPALANPKSIESEPALPRGPMTSLEGTA